MPERDPTRIGRVQHVLGGVVTAALDDDLAGVAPIYHGRLQPIGQIGSLVRIPQGLVDLIGQVSLLGIAELSGTQVPSEVVQVGQRWLQIQLLGEVDRATGRFERGYVPTLVWRTPFILPRLMTCVPCSRKKAQTVYKLVVWQHPRTCRCAWMQGDLSFGTAQ